MENIRRLIHNKKSQPRYSNEMREVAKFPEKIKENKLIYDVYRNIASIDKLRYDITILYPEMLEEEFPKTYGHYHKHLEVMEVIHGKVLWLIQKYENDPKKIREAYLIHASEKEKAIFPYNFGTISINPGNEKIVLSNWMNIETKSNYEPNKQLHGMSYYILRDKKGKIFFEKNKNYDEIPELIHLKPRELPEFGITFDKPLYDLIKTPKKLDFLNNPEKYKNILTIEKCYHKI